MNQIVTTIVNPHHLSYYDDVFFCHSCMVEDIFYETSKALNWINGIMLCNHLSISISPVSH